MSYVRKLILAVVAAALVAGTVLTQDFTLARRRAFPAESDLLYLPRPSVLQRLSLGHHELTADLVFIRAIIYFGGEMAGRRDYTWLDNYLETIVALDPQFRTPYRWAGVATMYHGKKITPEDVRHSIHFLELGVKAFPDDWEL